MESNNVVERLKSVISKYVQENNKDFSLDTGLVSLGINSFNAIQILVDLEVEFEVEFTENMIVPEMFRSPQNILNSLNEILNCNC